jgi:hypothetical protein
MLRNLITTSNNIIIIYRTNATYGMCRLNGTSEKKVCKTRVLAMVISYNYLMLLKFSSIKYQVAYRSIPPEVLFSGYFSSFFFCSASVSSSASVMTRV